MKLKRILAWIMVAIMCVSVLPVNVIADDDVSSVPEATAEETVSVAEDEFPDEATADDEATAEEPDAPAQETEAETPALEIVPVTVTETIQAGAGGEENNDELFAGYVDRLFGIVSDASGAKKARRAAGSSLTGPAAVLYSGVAEKAAEIAAGRLASTVFEFTFEELGYTDTHYTAADLDVSEVVSGSSITQEAKDALGTKLLSQEELGQVNSSLLADFPYEFYWYDKTEGVSSSASYSIGAAYENGEYVVYFASGTATFSFSVAQGYQGGNEYTVDISLAQTAAAAAANAQTIVAAHASEGDYDKLTSYKDEICDLVSYNSAAADDNNNTPYGDPWQLIWVFDGDTTTNVVCEGYSKSFKYLCDQSTFSNDITCITATGLMDGGTGAGRHMWNIVNMDDGKNYLVDVTNCDSGTIGAPDQLFIVPYYDGDISNGYRFDCSGSYITYKYDSDLFDIYTSDELQISDNEYTAPVTSGSCGSDLTWSLVNGVLTITGSGGMDYYGSIAEVPWSRLADDITSVNISGATNISNYAFAGLTNLTSVTIGEGLTDIYDYAFENCDSLDQILLPQSLNSVSYNAFSGCLGLNNVEFAGSALKWCTEIYFGEGNDTLNNLAIVHPGQPSTGTCGDNLTWTLDLNGHLTITGSGEMYDYPSFAQIAYFINSVSFPEGLTTIGAYAFSGNSSITTITFPDSLQSIGEGAFMNCTSINDIVMPGEHDTFSGCTSIGRYAFQGCSSLVSVYIHKSMDEIGESAFDGCDDNLTITYENSILGWININIEEPNEGIENAHIDFEIEIRGECGDNVIWELRDDLVMFISGEGDMWDVQNKEERFWHQFREYIRSAVIDEGVTNVGAYTFSECTNLRRVTFSSTVESIDAYAFESCTSLGTVYLPETIIDIGIYAFSNSSITALTGAEGLRVISDHAFSHCSSLFSVPAMDNLTTLGQYAFEYCDLSADFVIPSRVRQIQEGTFYNSGVRTVRITANVRTIGNYAFYSCQRLVSIAADPESRLTSIDDYAFQYCSSLNLIDLNNATALNSLGYYSFAYCTSLGGWYMPESITSIGSYAFAYDTALSEIDLPLNLTSISDWMFEGCSSLTMVVVEDNVTSIGYGAFRSCTSLPGIYLPVGLTRIDSNAFYNCSSMTAIDMPETLTYLGGYAFAECRKLSSVVFDDALQTIGSYAFNNCTNLTSVSLPEALTYISEGTFNGCTALRTVTFADSNNMTYIEDSAFANCSRISTLIIPVGVTGIGASAFYSCYNLDDITLPVTVNSIGNQAFDGCSSLFDVYYGGTEEVWNMVSVGTDNEYLLDADFHFGEVLAAGRCGDNLFAVLTPDGTLTITGTGDMWDMYNEYWGGDYVVTGTAPWSRLASRVTSVVLPDGLTSIGGGAFIDCINLKRVDVPSGVTTIGKYAFKGCKSLESVTIPVSMVSYYEDCFTDCDSLSDIYYEGSALDFYNYLNGWLSYLPDSIDIHATLPCSGTCGDNISWELAVDGTLTVSGSGNMTYDDYSVWRQQIFRFIRNVIIEEGITNIGNYAFQSCRWIKEVVLPDSITSIGYYVFSECSYLETINLPDSIVSIDSYSFYGCSSLKEIVIPESVTYISDSAFGNCTALESVIIPDSVSSISNSAFKNCISLTEISLSAEVGYEGFKGCTALRKVTFKNITQIGNSAFSNCIGLEEIILPISLTYIENSAFSGCSALSDVYYAGTELAWGRVSVDANNSPLMGAQFHYGNIHAAGKCGDNLYSILTDDGVLTITGSGDMWGRYTYVQDENGHYIYDENGNYVYRGDYPWSPFVSLITDVKLPDELTSIGVAAFAGCTNLQEITIPISVKRIYDYAFDDCEGLTDVYYPGSALDYYDNLNYWSYSENTEVHVALPSYGTCGDNISWELAVDGTFIAYGNGSMENTWILDKLPRFIIKVVITEGITDIEHDAFDQMPYLTEVSLPDSLLTIGEQAFSGCVSLKTISIPERVSSIESYTFFGCSALESVTLSDSVSYIYANAFGYCTSLKSIATIGAYTEIYGNSSIISGLDSLTDIYFTGTDHMWRYHGDKASNFPDNVRVHYGTITDIEKVEALDPTCVSEGHIEYWDCKSYTNLFSDEEGLNQIDWNDVTLPATGIHTWGDWTVSYNPTCMSEGMRYHNCEVCNAYEEDYIPMLDHDIVSEVIAPTCTEQGYTHTYCRYGCGTNEEYTNYVDALGHDWDEGTITQAPSCSEGGIMTYTCHRCGETYEGYIEPTYVHIWGEWTIEYEPTCMSEGKRYHTCVVCGEWESEYIPMLDHDIVSEVVEPTCTEPGYTHTYCRYGCLSIDEYTDYVEALGHDWDEGNVIQEPTCTEWGIMTHTCHRCGETNEENMEPLGHDFVYVPATEPTTEDEGNIEYYYCDRCGHYFDIALEEIDPSSVIIDRLTLIDISEADIKLNLSIKSGTYWGYYNLDHYPSVEVTYGEYGRLGEDVDYALTYQNNGSVGLASVVITGTGDFTGSVTIPYMICFSDVPMTHNFQKAVYWAVGEGIAAGYSGDKTGTFGVGDNITRGQVVMFLWRAAGQPKAKDLKTQTFTDVKTSSAFYKAIQWAVEEAITGGYSDGTFRPGDNCTRGQIATFLWRYAGKPAPVGKTQTFTDVPTSSNYYKAIQWAVENGITGGYTGARAGQFGPSDTCTRGQCVTFLYRLLGE